MHNHDEFRDTKNIQNNEGQVTFETVCFNVTRKSGHELDPSSEL